MKCFHLGLSILLHAVHIADSAISQSPGFRFLSFWEHVLEWCQLLSSSLVECLGFWMRCTHWTGRIWCNCTSLSSFQHPHVSHGVESLHQNLFVVNMLRTSCSTSYHRMVVKDATDLILYIFQITSSHFMSWVILVILWATQIFQCTSFLHGKVEFLIWLDSHGLKQTRVRGCRL